MTSFPLPLSSSSGSDGVWKRRADGRRPPAITDVAAAAGVSYQTVSRVVNGQPGVSQRTRERVTSVMRELGYQPNALARSLVTGRSRSVGLVTLASQLYGPARTAGGIDEAARAAGYDILTTTVTRLDAAGVAHAVDTLQRRAVDGVIVAHHPEPDAVDALRELSLRMPLVVTGGVHVGISSLDHDGRTSARLAVEHLLDLGHSCVWHVAGPLEWAAARERYAGWEETLVARGVTPPPPVPGGWGPRFGYDAGRLLARDRDVTAIFAANDSMALGLLLALDEAGRRVPDDVSVVGFDDIPEAAYTKPPLTTVRQDFTRLGSLAVAMLLEQIDAASPVVGVRQLVPALVVRSTTAAPGHATVSTGSLGHEAITIGRRSRHSR